MNHPRERRLFLVLVFASVLGAIFFCTTLYYSGRSGCPDITTTTTAFPPTTTTPKPPSTEPTKPTTSTKPTTTNPTTTSTTHPSSTTHEPTSSHKPSSTTHEPSTSTTRKHKTTTDQTTEIPFTVPMLHKKHTTTDASTLEEQNTRKDHDYQESVEDQDRSTSKKQASRDKKVAKGDN